MVSMRLGNPEGISHIHFSEHCGGWSVVRDFVAITRRKVLG